MQEALLGHANIHVLHVTATTRELQIVLMLGVPVEKSSGVSMVITTPGTTKYNVKNKII